MLPVPPLTETTTVSSEPAPFGPSIREVDSVRRSGALARGRSRVGMGSRSQGMRVKAAPLKSCSKGSCGAPGAKKLALSPFPPFSRPVGPTEGKGNVSAVLDTEMTRSSARR